MRGMIVGAQPEAVEAGAEILRRGGNAIDAAIACAFSQGVVDPQMCSIGGFGAMQICMPRPIRAKPVTSWPRCCMRIVCS